MKKGFHRNFHLNKTNIGKNLSAICFWMLAFFAPFTVHGQDSTFTRDTPITIQLYDIVNQVLAYHPSIKEAKLQRPMADANLMSSRGAFDPNVAFVIGGSNSSKDNNYGNQVVDLNLPIYTGGNLRFGNRNYDGSYYSDPGIK